ncbi:MAG: TrkA family potassium uptake protein [Opitutales bacterium]|nr:TrkA family potassium uptake protein [Opitutales bacterium]
MKYCVIGLGIFGRHLCTHLASLGAEVLAIDPREENVAAVKDIVDASVELDFSDPAPFAQFPIREMDAVVIAIGDNFEASMMLTLRMQELGAKKIICRVLSPMHERLLKLLKVDRLVVPEEFAARGLAHSMMISGVIDGYDLGDGHVIIEAKVPAGLAGKTLEQVALTFRKYSILLVTVKRRISHPLLSRVLPMDEITLDDEDDRATLGVPKLDVEFKSDDILVLFGAEKNLPRFLDAVAADATPASEN